uniref:Anthranilate-CoA ligase n=1 Tax=Stigmatella aurantiaca TaxID=41 RepID=F3Y661_STIAU|nr:anthranilate-CoA ligase [Stigmatella aurantiaca Sg a15]
MKASDLPLYYNAVDILERNLPVRANKTALFTPDREMTFRQVSNEANQVGNALKGLGVRFGECVGLLTLDSAEWVTSFFGIVKLGAIAVGINTLLKPPEYEYILRDCRARVLIVHQEFLPLIESIRGNLPMLEHIVVIGEGPQEGYLSFNDWIRPQPTTLEAAQSHREDICSLNYSSGTTGGPKGIPHAHKDYPLTAQLWGVNVLGLRESDRTFALAKLFFTFGTGGNLIFPWYVGASCVLFPGAARVASNVLSTISRFKPTIFYNAPTGYAAALALKDFSQHDLSSLRLCVSASEALPAALWYAWKEATGVDIIDGIGCTENFHIFISNRPGDIRPGSSGKPVEGYELKLVDDEGKTVPAGEIGNVLLRSETAALSYWHNFEKSRQTFQGEWLATGDKYFVDADGYYWHAGRSDDMLKVGGIWVSPVEVESTLIQHPAVQECAVIGCPDQSRLIKPKAFIILKPEQIPSEALIRQITDHCTEKMAAYKRPRWIEFVTELPKTATGKIQRFKLRSAA